jgi:hypothetical protein
MRLYDPDIIQQYAESLYQKAERVILGPTIALGLMGLGVGLLLRAVGAGSGLLVLFLAGGGGFAGWQLGQAQAFQLRLQAQQAHGQPPTEINTRPRFGADEAADEQQYRPNWGRQPQL